MVTVGAVSLVGVCTTVAQVVPVTVSLKLSGTDIPEQTGVVWGPRDPLVCVAVGVATDVLKLPAVLDAVLGDTVGWLVLVVTDCTVDEIVVDETDNIVPEVHVNWLS